MFAIVRREPSLGDFTEAGPESRSGGDRSGRAPSSRRQGAFYYQRERAAERAENGGSDPDRARRVVEDETPDGWPECEPDLPRECRQGHVPAEKTRVGEIGDEWGMHRAVQALAHGEDHHRQGEQERRSSGRLRPGDRDEQPRRGTR